MNVLKILLVLTYFFVTTVNAKSPVSCLISNDSSDIYINKKIYSSPKLFINCCQNFIFKGEVEICTSQDNKCQVVKSNQYDLSQQEICKKDKSDNDFELLLKLKSFLQADSTLGYAMFRGSVNELSLPGDKILLTEGSLHFDSDLSVQVINNQKIFEQNIININDLTEGFAKFKICDLESCITKNVKVISPSIEEANSLGNLTNLNKKLFLIKNQFYLNVVSR